MFKRLGRAMLRPLFNHCRGKTSNFKVISPLSLALRWWKDVLAMRLCQHKPWEPSLLPVVQLIGDASGSPAWLAAVLLIDGRTFYCDMGPTEEQMTFFTKRKDNQICGLELLSIALGFSTFGHLIKGRKVHVYSDNKGAESSTSKGAARAFDHTCIVHCLWTKAAQLEIELVVDRVPTKDNIADLPSRGKYLLLQKIGAEAVEAKLDAAFCKPTAWEALALPNGFC